MDHYGKLALVVILAILGSACSSPTIAPAGPAAAIVLGLVTDSSGNPVAGKAISIVVHHRDCGGSVQFTTTVSTGADGWYLKELQGPTAGNQCVRVTATAISGSAETSVFSDAIVDFRWPGRGNVYPPLDSVYLNLRV